MCIEHWFLFACGDLEFIEIEYKFSWSEATGHCCFSMHRTRLHILPRGRTCKKCRDIKNEEWRRSPTRRRLTRERSDSDQPVVPDPNTRIEVEHAEPVEAVEETKAAMRGTVMMRL
jgi:hypothetical protein